MTWTLIGTIGGAGSVTAGSATPPARLWRQSIGPGAPTIVTTGTVRSNGHVNAFPAITVGRDGTIFVAYRDAPAGLNQSDSGDAVYQTSSDGGQTWSGQTVLATPASGHDLQPTAIACTRTGRLLFSYWDYPGTLAGSAVKIAHSDDNGATWSSFATLATYTSAGVGGGQILAHSSGVLLLPVYGENTGDTAYQNGVLRSSDDGATWSAVVTMAGANTNYDEMALVELPGGDIRAFVRQESSSSGLYTTTSTDAGLTWSSLVGLGFGAWGGMPGAALFPVGQELVLFYRRVADQSCAWRYSLDLGTTWSAEQVISGDKYDYAGLCPLSDHLLGIAYAHSVTTTADDLEFLTMAAGVPVVSGSRTGNAALASLLGGLARQGDILDTTTAGTAPPSGLAVSHNGTAVATAAGLNVIDGTGVTLTVADNSGAGRVDVTVASTSAAGTASSLLVILPNGNTFVADGTSDEQPPDFITVGGDVIGVGGM